MKKLARLWLAVSLAVGLLGVTPVGAQEMDLDPAMEDPLGTTWSGTITYTEQGTWQVVPEKTETFGGTTITTKHDISANTTVTITLENGFATASVSHSPSAELSVAYSGCVNGRYAQGGTGSFSGTVDARVGVSIDESGTYDISVGVPGVPGATRGYLVVEGLGSDCKGNSVDLAALGIRSTSDTSSGLSDRVSLDIQGQAEPGAMEISGSQPMPSFVGSATATYNLSATGCDLQATEEARDLVGREAARLDEAAAQPVDGEPAPPEDPAASLGLRAATVRLQQVPASLPLSSEAVNQAMQSATARPDRVAMGDLTEGSSGGISRFAVRLSGDGRALPTLETIMQLVDSSCVQPGTIEGAPTLLIGSVQWTGDEFRINLRTVDTETGVITQAVSTTGRGGSGELSAALASALSAFIQG